MEIEEMLVEEGEEVVEEKSLEDEVVVKGI